MPCSRRRSRQHSQSGSAIHSPPTMSERPVSGAWSSSVLAIDRNARGSSGSVRLRITIMVASPGSIANRLMGHRGAIGPRVLAKMLLVVDEEWGIRVVAPSQVLECHRFIERIELFDRLWPVERPDLETRRNMLKRGAPGVGPDQNA